MSVRTQVRVVLAAPATEMAQEEIVKQLAFLSAAVHGVVFTAPDVIELDTSVDDVDALARDAGALAARIQRTLRTLKRKVAFTSTASERPAFLGADQVHDGIDYEAFGLTVLSGVPLQLWEYFDRTFREFGRRWRPSPMRVPTLIPTTALARCDYFRSFPHNVTFAAHLPEDPARIESFRARHHTRETLDDQALSDLVTPEACLSPAVCYHAYYAYRDRTIATTPTVLEMAGKCFRYESSNTRDLRRLWDFTMREVVFLGGKQEVLAERADGMTLFQEFLESHRIAAEIRTASDPFFIAPDAAAKTYFQINADTKYEISMLLPDNGRLAVGSFNYHGAFFGKAFHCVLPDQAPMHSVCFAWGIERWVYGFLQQHGGDPAKWPDVMRHAPEFHSW
jgi:hypothetical protein